MRVTDGMRQTDALRSLSQLSARHADATSRALTGRSVGLPSSDPSAAAELVRNRAAQHRNETAKEAASLVRSDLETAEGALAEAGDLFQRAHEIAMQGANGTLNAEQRRDLGVEVGHIKTQLLALANSKGSQGYLFGGTQVNTTPFAAGGVFSGDDNARVADLGTGSPMAVSVSGERAFTAAGGRNVFADLDALETALSTNDQAGVGGTLSNLETSRKQIMSAQSDAGFKLERITTTEAVMDRVTVTLAQHDEEVGGADPYAAYSDLVSLGQALEQAVAVSKRILDLGGLFRT
ncbi:MAG TPA: flagellar hook-associated protein FlgL [Polyangiaceae bacterium]